MKTVYGLLSALLFVVSLVSTSAFAPSKSGASTSFVARAGGRSRIMPLNMAIFDDNKEREKLTRDTEPDQYFQT